MLVLTRKVGEQLIIGDDIRITVVEICRNQVRLGITAPAEIGVLRKELCPPEASGSGAPDEFREPTPP